MNYKIGDHVIKSGYEFVVTGFEQGFVSLRGCDGQGETLAEAGDLTLWERC